MAFKISGKNILGDQTTISEFTEEKPEMAILGVSADSRFKALYDAEEMSLLVENVVKALNAEPLKSVFEQKGSAAGFYRTKTGVAFYVQKTNDLTTKASVAFTLNNMPEETTSRIQNLLFGKAGYDGAMSKVLANVEKSLDVSPPETRPGRHM